MLEIRAGRGLQVPSGPLRSLIQVLLRKSSWRSVEPRFDDNLFEVRDGDLLQPDEDCRTAVEVRRSEVHVGLIGEQRFLDPHVGDPDAQDWPVGCLSEWCI
jgi:hypothetical protein